MRFISILAISIVLALVATACASDTVVNDSPPTKDTTSSNRASTRERATATSEPAAAVRTAEATRASNGENAEGQATHARGGAKGRTPHPELEALRPGVGLEIPTPLNPPLLASGITISLDEAAYPLHLAAYSGTADDVVSLLNRGEYVEGVASVAFNMGRGDTFIDLEVNLPSRDGSLLFVSPTCPDCSSPTLPEDRSYEIEVKPLHLSAMNNSLGVVKALIEEGDASVDTKALEFAAMYNKDLGVLEYLLELHGEAIEDEVLLHRAVQQRNPDASVVKFLIDKGAAPDDSLYRSGFSPLHVAAALNEGTETIELLLMQGGRVDMVIGSLSPSSFAARYNGNPEVLAALIDKWFDSNVADLDTLQGQTVGDLVEGAQRSIDIYLGHLLADSVRFNAEPAVTDLLLKWGADVNFRGAAVDDRSIIQLTIQSDPAHFVASIVKVLVAHDVDLDTEDFLPLHRAVDHHPESPELLALLLDHGAEINGRDDDGRTPLHVAGGTYHVHGDHAPEETILFLVENGANLNAKDRNNVSAFEQILLRHHTPGFVETLIKHGAEVNSTPAAGNSLHSVMKWAYAHPDDGLAVLELLLDSGADPSHQPGGVGRIPCQSHGSSGILVSRSYLAGRMLCNS